MSDHHTTAWTGSVTNDEQRELQRLQVEQLKISNKQGEYAARPWANVVDEIVQHDSVMDRLS